MMGDWTFFSNYGHVLVCLARNREVRLRDVAAEVGITERAVQKIVRDLQDAGYLTISKQGRCNRYRINRRKTLRHSLQSHCTVGKLLTLMAKPARSASRVQQDPEAAEQFSADAASQDNKKRKLEKTPAQQPGKTAVKQQRKPEEKESKSNLLDTRQQGSLF
jgi:Mn-dependent DtxR family transcriptional regulator